MLNRNLKILGALLAVFVLSLTLSGGRAKDVVKSIQCVPVTECPFYLKVLKRRPLQDDDIRTVRLANCGFENLVEKVWCPNITYVDAVKPDEFKSTVKRKSHHNFVYSSGGKEIELNFPSGCGELTYNKIVGGRDAEPEEQPWLGLLQYKYPDEDFFRMECGGVLISDRYVLTAAHCLTLSGPPQRVLFGEYDLNNETDCVKSGNKIECLDPPQSIKIDQEFITDEWQKDEGEFFYDDLALLRLETPVNFTELVQPICLPAPDVLLKNASMFAAGWGLTENGTQSNIKQIVGVPVVSNDKCTKAYKRRIIETQLCAGGEKGKDSCTGDSGGPLVYIDEKVGRYVLGGIISKGSPKCGEKGVPAIHTYIPKYLKWIFERMIN